MNNEQINPYLKMYKPVEILLKIRLDLITLTFRANETARHRHHNQLYDIFYANHLMLDL